MAELLLSQTLFAGSYHPAAKGTGVAVGTGVFVGVGVLTVPIHLQVATLSNVLFGKVLVLF